MKKTIITTLFFGSLVFASCGGNNAEADAAKEQAKVDSINAVLDQARLDSVANAEEQEKISADLEQARLDSIEAADAANASKKGGTKAPAPTKTATPVVEPPIKKGGLKKDLESTSGEKPKDGETPVKKGGLKEKLK